MWRHRLLWKLFLTYALVVAFCTLIVGGLVLQHERASGRERLVDDLVPLAQAFDERFAPFMIRVDPGADSLVKRISPPGTRITLIGPEGRVLADTNVDPRSMENHRFRTEVQAALGGRVGSDERTSASDFAAHLYVAIPSAHAPGWAVRVAIPLDRYQARLRETTNRYVLGAVAAMGLGLVIGFLFVRRIVRPLRQIEAGLERLDRGEIGSRLDASAAGEIGMVARTLNRVHDQLAQSLDSVTAQRNQRDAILSSMVEGLVAVDGDDRVLLVNAAARELLGLGTVDGDGRTLLEIVRIPQLVQFVEQVRTSTEPLRIELVVRGQRQRYLELHGAALRISETGRRGAVIVFNDVTRLRKLEEIRKEFVANVSHEIKTPITSIKGFLETLLEGGALEEPESARRFLTIVSRQTERLGAIIDDLLYLSRLEYEDRPLALQPVNLERVVERSVLNFEHAAASRGIRLEMRVEADERFVLGDDSLLARAVDNLLDNAIKYSPAGRRVEVALRESPESLLLQVTDEGIGIAEEHLPRISERFYRVDTARSREMGGTGLGLAIVKHIARVHSGGLEIESRQGEGSRFTIRLPRRADAA